MRGGIVLAAVSIAGALLLVACEPLAAAPRNDSGKDRDIALPSEPPAGPLHIIVSIAKQRATLYSNGRPIVSTPVSTGTAGFPTPTGVFSVVQKRIWHESNIYSNGPMPFMQRITWSGVSLHEGVLPGYPASHGCIRLPGSVAKWLFGVTDLGLRVIVANDEPAVEEISHPLLFTGRTLPRPIGISPSLPRKLAGADVDAGDPQDAARINTVGVFISRKEGRLFVRRNFAPVFDAPVRFENRQRPLGTHVFTAMDVKNDGSDMGWSVVSLNGDDGGDELHDRYDMKERWIDGRAIRTVWFSRERWTPQTPGEVLDRIDAPQAAVERISELLTPGSSLIVSDEGLNKESRRPTEFVVLTAPPASFLRLESSEQAKRRARQEPVMRLQPATAQPVASQSSPGTSVDAVQGTTVDTPRTADPPPRSRRTTARPVAVQRSQGPDATPPAEEQRSTPGANGAPVVSHAPPDASPDAGPRVNDRRSVSRSENVEPTRSLRRARREAAPRANGRPSASRATTAEPATLRSSRRANFADAFRGDDRRSNPRRRNETAAGRIELSPPQ